MLGHIVKGNAIIVECNNNGSYNVLCRNGRVVTVKEPMLLEPEALIREVARSRAFSEHLAHIYKSPEEANARLDENSDRIFKGLMEALQKC